MPAGHELRHCYRLADSSEGDETDEANAHLLAALGKFDQPFVPVEIRDCYDGYSWAKLATIDTVTLTAGRTLQESEVAGGLLICVDSLAISVRCSDGTGFSAPVCMALKPQSDDPQHLYLTCEVYVTPEARQRLGDSQIWHHFGGYNDDGDSYETQEYDFGKELEAFWNRLVGPLEPLRCKLMDCLMDLKHKWKRVTIEPDGRVRIIQHDGSEKELAPPKA